jgi:drug/metabolite transporter (DMT)-like permease
MALIMAAIAFGETPGPEALAGLALIIVGLVIVDGRVIGR